MQAVKGEGLSWVLGVVGLCDGGFDLVVSGRDVEGNTECWFELHKVNLWGYELGG
jgi:hypothetical protein